MRKRQKILKELRENWGKPKEDYFHFDLIEEYALYREEQGETYHLDERYLKDVDFEDYFRFVDRTVSSIGQQYLYSELTALNQEAAYLEDLEEKIQFYTKDEDKRLNTQAELKKVSKLSDYYFPFLIFGDLPEKLPYIWALKALQAATFLLIFLSFIFPQLAIAVIIIFCSNVFLHYWHKPKISRFAQVFARLSKLVIVSTKLLSSTTLPSDQQKKIEEDIEQLDKLSSQILLLKTDDLQGNEFTSIIWYFFELLKILSISEIITFHRVISKIEQERRKIESLYRFVGEIDMAISVASLRSSLPYYCIPKFTEAKKELNFEGIYHPLVENCVANDLHLKNKSLLLTGSNMSGKSTFVKAVNLNLITAQVLNTAFAHSYQTPFLQAASSIKISDDLNEKKSYFMEEVLAVGELIEHSKRTDAQFLFTLDELFKGTNTIERVSSAKAILEFLNKGQHIILVSTHDIELTLLLKSGFELHYFQETIVDENLSFDYILKQGALKKRNAINIIELAGYPEEVLTDARSLAANFEKEKTGN
ncbi:MAG: DNA mismatch repair protein MutS [Bacteroidota bacterium]